jgi:hypothetical protein
MTIAITVLCILTPAVALCYLYARSLESRLEKLEKEMVDTNHNVLMLESTNLDAHIGIHRQMLKLAEKL